jgi:hypothetical protein
MVDYNNDGYYADPHANSWLYRIYSYDTRADIFYDRNNTSFYLDPAGTSILNLLKIIGLNVDGDTELDGNLVVNVPAGKYLTINQPAPQYIDIRGIINASMDVHAGQSLRANGKIVAGNGGDDPIGNMGDGDIAAANSIYVGALTGWFKKWTFNWKPASLSYDIATAEFTLPENGIVIGVLPPTVSPFGGYDRYYSYEIRRRDGREIIRTFFHSNYDRPPESGDPDIWVILYVTQ